MPKKMLFVNRGKLQKKIYPLLQPKLLLFIGNFIQFRVDQYMPDDSIGLPKPYGMYKPFKPTPLGSNIRHIRKP